MHTPLIQSLDILRASWLRFTLRAPGLRSIYQRTSSRLSLGLALTFLLYFPLAILWPHLLLVSGPLIFGYPHLVASFRFSPVHRRSSLLFFLFTLLAVGLHLGSPVEVPFGVWQLVVATLALLTVGSVGFLRAGLAILFCAGMIHLAQRDPIIFVGGSLILHNWVGFFHWVRCTRGDRQRVALLSTLAFALIHLCVLSGAVDALIPLVNGRPSFAATSGTTAWLLASWSVDEVVWYRWLILYAFGLSVHYYVWLKAIPESLNPAEHPNSFRVIQGNLQRSLGKTAWTLTLVGLMLGVGVWGVSSAWGAKLYFEVAILHGALELMLLFSSADGYPRHRRSTPLPSPLPAAPGAVDHPVLTAT